MSRRTRLILVSVVVALLGPVIPAASAAFPASAAAAARPAWQVSSIAREDVRFGDRLLIRGTVAPGARGRYVYVEARSPGSPVFQTRRAVMVRSGSRYSVSVFPDEPGVWRFRVHKPAGDGRRAAYSPVQVVSVWRWRPLESMLVEPEESVGTTPVAPVGIGGLTFADGYLQAPGGARFFRLRKLCSRVDVWIGGDPASTTDDAAEVSVDGAGGEGFQFLQHLATATVRRDGAAARLVLTPTQVRPVFYLRISYGGTIEGNGAAWGSPRAYCLF